LWRTPRLGRGQGVRVPEGGRWRWKEKQQSSSLCHQAVGPGRRRWRERAERGGQCGPRAPAQQGRGEKERERARGEGRRPRAPAQQGRGESSCAAPPPPARSTHHRLRRPDVHISGGSVLSGAGRLCCTGPAMLRRSSSTALGLLPGPLLPAPSGTALPCHLARKGRRSRVLDHVPPCLVVSPGSSRLPSTALALLPSGAQGARLSQ
jgi:hypothetical protein